MSSHAPVDLTGSDDEEEVIPGQVSNPPSDHLFTPLATTRPRQFDSSSHWRNPPSLTIFTSPTTQGNYVWESKLPSWNHFQPRISDHVTHVSKKRKPTSDIATTVANKRIQASSPVCAGNTQSHLEIATDGTRINPILIQEGMAENDMYHNGLAKRTHEEQIPPDVITGDTSPDLSILAQLEIVDLLYEDEFGDNDSNRDSNQDISIVEHPSATSVHDESLAANLNRLQITRYQPQVQPSWRYTHNSASDGVFAGIKYCCEIGKCVEIANGSFIRIRAFHQNLAGVMIISGDRLVRQNECSPKMPKQINEVVWMREFNENQPVDIQTSDYYQVRETEIVRNRTIFFTNQIFPKLSAEDDLSVFNSLSRQETEGPLFCRWVETITLGPKTRAKESVIQHLCSEQADDKFKATTSNAQVSTRINDDANRLLWRGIRATPGGSHVEIRTFVDLAGREVDQIFRSYTFGDAFCGAGGTSRGALEAGFQIKWGFDLDEHAIKSYKGNFGKLGTDCRQEAVHEFVLQASQGDFMVDVLHISPPCQPFSAANTTPNIHKNEVNQAAMFSVQQLLETIRPRVVTIEETDGLLTRYHVWFCALVEMLISHSYSVRWKVVKCADYGVPQTRKRLFLIASGPGEVLPPFASPTHGENDPSLKPSVTIEHALRNVDVGNLDHDTEGAKFQNGVTKTPFSSNGPAKTVTCNVGQNNYFPSGTRSYTIREVARIQTFPSFHTFDGASHSKTVARRQIGNAVPPSMAKAMYREILKSLKKSDGVQ